jgi:hypothetical protein
MTDGGRALPDLRLLVANTTLEGVLKFDPMARQLPTLLSVAHGLRPACDLWVAPERLSVFAEWALEAGCHFAVDGYFEPLTKPLRGAVHTTTRANWRQEPAPGREAHIFVGRKRDAVDAALSAGWYPLVVGGAMVEKHPADHDAFGVALGYPMCCRRFFTQRNDWHVDNTLFAAFAATRGRCQALSNPLLRHTAFGLVPHMPCSFACPETVQQATALMAVIKQEAPLYAQELNRRLLSPALCLSENRLYRFEGSCSAEGNRITYGAVELLPPTPRDDSLGTLLQQGDAISLERNIVTVELGGASVSTYFARADIHGPEAPFLIQCSS